MRTLAAVLMTISLWSQSEPAAKTMFYDPGDLGLLPARSHFADCARWMPIVRQTDDSTPGEIGTYVMNRDGGVSAEVVFRAR